MQKSRSCYKTGLVPARILLPAPALTLVLALAFVPMAGRAQEAGEDAHFRPSTSSPFTLTRVNDTLYYLNEWRLPYAVYQFQTGDVDGDGSEDALVGVVKPTRFYPEKARRLFLFKQVHGKVRPLWMGSRLGGLLEDFRFHQSCVVSLETNVYGRYAVAEYQWEKFGLEFRRFLAKDVSRREALHVFDEATDTSPHAQTK